MVTTAEIMRAALREDTLIARAFLRALGIFVPYGHREGEIAPCEHVDYDSDVLWCFTNHGSPMDNRSLRR